MTYGAAPYGAAPYGADAGGRPPVQGVTLADGLTLAAADAAQVIATLREAIAATGSLVPRLNRHVSADDGLAYSEALGLVWQLAAAEGLDFAGTASANATRLGALIDTVHALGLVATRLDAMTAVATVLAVNGMLATGWQLEAIDSIGFQDALAGSLRAIGALVDSAGFHDAPAPSLRLVAIAADGVLADATPGARLDLTETLRDDVLAYVTLRLGDAEYVGWVLHDGAAATEYRQYPFNGFVEFPPGSKRYLATADDGLYRLGGDTDDGDGIAWSLQTALMDFGTGLRKRIPDVFIAYRGGGEVVLRVRAAVRGSTERTEHWYTATLPAGTEFQNGRLKVGRGLESRYWQFGLQGVSSDAFAIDELAFHPLVLDRRL